MDAISFVEQCYDLSTTRDAWLENLLALAYPELDRGKGVFATEARVKQSTEGTIAIPTSCVDEENRDYFSRLLGRLTNRWVEPLAIDAPSVGSLSDFISWGISEAGAFRRVLSQTETYPDLFVLRGWSPGCPNGVGIVAPLPQATESSKRTLWRWRRLMHHLEAAYRLRSDLQNLPPGQEFVSTNVAVFRPSGQLVHAENKARDISVRDQLRNAVLRCEKARASMRHRDPEAALENWDPLVAGQWSLVDRFEQDGRRYIVAYPNGTFKNNPRAFNSLELRIAEGLTEGKSQKRLAYELGLNPSSLAKYTATISRKLGARSKIDLIHTLNKLQEQPTHRLPIGDQHAAIWISEPPSIPHELSRTEQSIFREIMAGSTNASIAKKRRTSIRTVSNQVSAIFSKLGVNSREELVATTIQRNHGSNP